MRRSYFEKVHCKSKSENAFMRTRNRKTFVVDCTKKTRNIPSVILTRLLLPITSYSGKQLNHFFQTRQMTGH